MNNEEVSENLVEMRSELERIEKIVMMRSKEAQRRATGAMMLVCSMLLLAFGFLAVYR